MKENLSGWGEVRMDVLQQGIITLIRSAITREKHSLPQGFDLESAYAQICQHRILPLVYLGAVQCGISQTLPVMQKLFDDYQECRMRSEQQMKELDHLFAAFDRAGLEYMPIQGCVLKALYPKPEMRLMNNVDMLIRMEQYERMRQILTGLGFEARIGNGQQLNWNQKTLSLELHKRLIPSYNKSYRQFFEDGWRLASMRSGTQYSMVREDTLIYLFTQFAKHYHDGDIDCRHVVDLWVFRQAYTAFHDAHVRTELKNLRLLAFYDSVQAMLAVWFGDAEATEKTNFMTDYIFNSGASAENEAFAAATDADKENSTEVSFFHRLLTNMQLDNSKRRALKYVGLNFRFQEHKNLFKIK